MDEQDFRRYLDGGSRLNALYRNLAAEEPSADVDATILAAARQEATQPARQTLWQRARGLFLPGRFPPWTLPWSTAAAAAGLVALVTTMLLEGGAPDPPGTTPSRVASPATATGSRAAQPPSAAARIPAVPATAGTTAPAVPPATTRKAATGAHPDPLPAVDTAGARLAAIEQLLQEGRQDEARARYYLFRERYPSHPVPQDLLPRLGM